MRSFNGDYDLQAIVDLFDACEQVDKIDLSISVAQLKIELEDPLTHAPPPQTPRGYLGRALIPTALGDRLR